jgi:hypothetical protein
MKTLVCLLMAFLIAMLLGYGIARSEETNTEECVDLSDPAPLVAQSTLVLCCCNTWNGSCCRWMTACTGFIPGCFCQ